MSFQTSYLEVSQWVDQAFTRLTEEMIQRSFTACGIMPTATWSDDVHSRLKERICPDEPFELYESSSDDEESLEDGLHSDDTTTGRA